MLHGFNFSEVVLLSKLICTCSNASNSQVIHYQRSTLHKCAAHTQPNW